VVQKGHHLRQILEGEKKGERKIKGVMRIGRSSLQAAKAETDNAITTSMAEETENAISVSDNRAHSNEGS